MKKFVTILTVIILTLPIYSQENVFYSYITHGSCFGSHDVEILIPFGKQFIYERYRYFQYYTLMEKDTLNVDDKILKSLPKTEKLLKATEILKKSSLRGKTYRKVKEHLIKNYTEVDRG